MKRKHFSLIAVLVISLGMTFCSITGIEFPAQISNGQNLTCNSEIELKDEESFDSEYFSNTNRSVELYDQVINPYITSTTEHDGVKRDMYRDEFAGIWLNDLGFLIVGIAADDGYIRKLQAERSYSGQVIYHRHTFSYNYLQDIMSV